MYYPDEEERKAFERYLEREGIEDEREVQERLSKVREEYLKFQSGIPF